MSKEAVTQVIDSIYSTFEGNGEMEPKQRTGKSIIFIVQNDDGSWHRVELTAQYLGKARVANNEE